MGEGKPPASGKKKGHKNQLLKPLPKSGLKPFEYFQHLLEELPQIDRTDKEKLKRYLPYSDALSCLLQGTGPRNKQLACTVSAAGKHKAVMPANIQLASVTAFFMPYVRMA